MSFSYRILIFLFLIFLGFFFASLFQYIIALAYGISLSEISTLNADLGSGRHASMIRLSLFASHLFSIILPAFIYLRLTQKNNILSFLKARFKPSSILLLLCILALFSSLPLVNFSYQVNQSIPLPSWMMQAEDHTASIIQEILKMETPLAFIVNILLIAVTPAIGEELLFRGVVQQEIERKWKKPWVAIVLSSVLFSAFHFQFEGFLPRFVLGFVLGYSYYITRNFWIPVILHFFNNATPIVALYFFNNDLHTIDPSSAPRVEWYFAMLSFAAVFILFFLVRKILNENRNEHV